MKFIATSLPIGILLLLTQAQEPDRKVIHLTEITCKILEGTETGGAPRHRRMAAGLLFTRT